jgi:hypothetical protein
MMTSVKRHVCTCALALLVPATVGAQTAQVGTISGEVKDSGGGVLPGVSLVATSQERGFSRTTTSDALGRFLFAAIPIGRYRVVASLTSFQTVTLVDNLVETEKTTELSFTLKLASLEAAVTVVGETPIVDMTNTSVNTRVRQDEFQRLPVGRSYQALMGMVPGVVGTGNVNAHGALTSNNLFLFDGVDTTDPTTGTFGTNFPFEAIQEMSVYTSAIPAEYGRGVGAIANVITKSGTNRVEGTAKYIATNDNWNKQNKTKSETNGASLARVKFDKTNPVYSFTGGGPIWLNHAWAFGAYEYAKNTSAQRQTVGTIPENYQQSTTSPFFYIRGTTQVSQSHTIWAKYHRSPTDGFVIDYWNNAAGERRALNGQNQGATSSSVQWSGVLRSNWTGEAMISHTTDSITVSPFESSPITNSAPHFSQADRKYYNGATFDGIVDRPGTEVTTATTYYKAVGTRSHNLKAGFGYRRVSSTNLFKYPNSQVYTDLSFDQATHTYVPFSRQDYDSGASTSKGNIYTAYGRDKFDVTKRLFVEAGLRYEHQTGLSDVGATTIDTNTFSPRLTATYDILGTGKTLIVGSYARLFQGLIQDFSDSFAGIPQQTNYNNFVWNGTTYVLNNRVELGASTFKPNTGLRPNFVDEYRIELQRQIGQTIGVGVRGIFRNWGDLIDDLLTFNPDGSTKRVVVNYSVADRTYRGIEFWVDKRLSNNWSANGSYVYARTRGNQFASTFSPLGDYLDAQCRTTVDPTIGVNGLFSCADVVNGSNQFGSPGNDRPHAVKASGAYTRPIGPVNLTAGALLDVTSATVYAKSRAMNVLLPGTLTAAGPTETYFYEPRGAERIPGPLWTLDTALEVTFRKFRAMQHVFELGVKGEVFNVSDRQEKNAVNNTTWCDNTVNPSASCQTARTTFGTATARGSFQAPQNFRVTALFRF